MPCFDLTSPTRIRFPFFPADEQHDPPFVVQQSSSINFRVSSPCRTLTSLSPLQDLSKPCTSDLHPARGLHIPPSCLIPGPSLFQQEILCVLLPPPEFLFPPPTICRPLESLRGSRAVQFFPLASFYFVKDKAGIMPPPLSTILLCLSAQTDEMLKTFSSSPQAFPLSS